MRRGGPKDAVKLTSVSSVSVRSNAEAFRFHRIRRGTMCKWMLVVATVQQLFPTILRSRDAVAATPRMVRMYLVSGFSCMLHSSVCRLLVSNDMVTTTDTHANFALCRGSSGLTILTILSIVTYTYTSLCRYFNPSHCRLLS
jgi:hypothetical protein